MVIRNFLPIEKYNRSNFTYLHITNSDCYRNSRKPAAPTFQCITLFKLIN